jgi:hypothetical protein
LATSQLGNIFSTVIIPHQSHPLSPFVIPTPCLFCWPSVRSWALLSLRFNPVQKGMTADDRTKERRQSLAAWEAKLFKVVECIVHSHVNCLFSIPSQSK